MIFTSATLFMSENVLLRLPFGRRIFYHPISKELSTISLTILILIPKEQKRLVILIQNYLERFEV